MSSTSKSRTWIFRALVIAATGFLAYSWFMPLWGLDIQELGRDSVMVYPSGEDLSGLGVWADAYNVPRMPAFFTPLMWIYFVGCIVLLLASLVLPERPFNLGKFRLTVPQAIIGGVGLVHVIFVAVAAIVITIILGTYEVAGVTTPLQGGVFLDFGAPYASYATSSLRSGYWLAWAAAIILIVLAILRPIIVGREQS